MKKFLEKDKSKILDEFIVSSDVFDAKWKPAKGAKKQTRKIDGLFTYNWSEGGMSEHDSIDKPARTIITSEGALPHLEQSILLNTVSSIEDCFLLSSIN